MSTVHLPPNGLEDVAATCLVRLGTPEDIAISVARWLVNADRSGHPSHGVIRLTDYARRIERGDLVPDGRPTVAEVPARSKAVLVDGQRGYGHLAADALVRELCDRAVVAGIAMGGIVNASHTGRLGEWAEAATRRGAIFLMCSASLQRANVAAYGAAEPRLGTNPLTVGVPASDGDGMIVDFATSEVSGGKLDYLVSAGEQAPEHALLDREGRPTRDPRAWRDGGALLTFGGHKGYGLSLLVALIGGCVVGQAAPGNPRHGAWACAIDPGAFAETRAVLAAVQVQLERMRTTPPRREFDAVEVPGDFERRNRARSAAAVAVDGGTWEQIVKLGGTLGLNVAGWAVTGARHDGDPRAGLHQ
ncbi:MAG: Ldh family oxidoreductase [Sciscionella sp.]